MNNQSSPPRDRRRSPTTRDTGTVSLHHTGVPPFEGAVERLRDFLRAEGAPGAMRWIWRESVILRKRHRFGKYTKYKLWIDATRLADDREIRTLYEAGAARGLGIALGAFCTASDCTMCYLDVPKDAIAAEYRMMTGTLRIGVADPLLTGRSVRYPLVASALRRMLAEPGAAPALDFLPRRAEVAQLSFVRHPIQRRTIG